MTAIYMPAGLPLHPWKAKKVLIVGSGAVGSRIAHSLVDMGVADTTVSDDARLPQQNVQDVQAGSCRQNKVALIINCADTVFTRMSVWKQVKKNQTQHPLYIDVRLVAGGAVIYSFLPCNELERGKYEHTLLSKSEDCSSESESFGDVLVSALATTAVVSVVTTFLQTGALEVFEMGFTFEPSWVQSSDFAP